MTQRDLFEDLAGSAVPAVPTVAFRGRERPARLMSLENERWMSIRKYVDAVMHQSLASGLQHHGIAYRVAEHGIEIAPYTREHILAFSDGLKSVQKALEVRGFTLESASGKAKEVANLTTRSETKRVAPLQAVHRMWLARAQNSGHPVFAPSDPRLAEMGRRQAMTPDAAIEAALDTMAQAGKRLHSDFALVRAAIRCSDYATPHQSITAEVNRRLESGELVHTERGVLRQADAALVARESREAVIAECRDDLAAAVQSVGFAEDSSHSSASLLEDAQRVALSEAVRARVGALVVADAAASSVAASLAEAVVECGLRPLLVADKPDDAGSASFDAGVAAVGSLDSSSVVIVTGGTARADHVAILRAATERAGGVFIELERAAPQLRPHAAGQKAGASAATEPHQSQRLGSKLAQLSSMAARHGSSLRTAIANLRGEGEQAPGQRQKTSQKL